MKEIVDNILYIAGCDIDEGDEVMITTGKLDSFYGHVISITRYQTKPDKARVKTLNERNEVTFRTYNLSNLIKS